MESSHPNDVEDRIAVARLLLTLSCSLEETTSLILFQHDVVQEVPIFLTQSSQQVVLWIHVVKLLLQRLGVDEKFARNCSGWPRNGYLKGHVYTARLLPDDWGSKMYQSAEYAVWKKRNFDTRQVTSQSGRRPLIVCMEFAMEWLNSGKAAKTAARLLK